ncbi:MAG: cytochrome c [Gammaproteobacteria bacterium]|nr:cytochrome c [Gammaproteobacteria bacterium]
MKHFLVTVCLASLLAAPAAMAAEDANEKAIKARRGAMQVRVFNAGPLFAMAKGEMAYDAELASTLAKNLSLETQMDAGRMWPKGSDNANAAYKGKTRSLPEIWSTYPAVSDKGKAYKEAVTKLNASAGNGLDALKAAVGDLGKACKGCHDDFRAKDF